MIRLIYNLLNILSYIILYKVLDAEIPIIDLEEVTLTDNEEKNVRKITNAII